MVNLEKEINKVIATMLTIAWGNTKTRDCSQTEIMNVYNNFLEKQGN